MQNRERLSLIVERLLKGYTPLANTPQHSLILHKIIHYKRKHAFEHVQVPSVSWKRLSRNVFDAMTILLVCNRAKCFLAMYSRVECSPSALRDSATPSTMRFFDFSFSVSSPAALPIASQVLVSSTRYYLKANDQACCSKSSSRKVKSSRTDAWLPL